VHLAGFVGKLRPDIVAVLSTSARMRCSMARICAGIGPAAAMSGGAAGAGAAAGAGTDAVGGSAGTGDAWRVVTAGAISARATFTSPHAGHSTNPAFACLSNAALLGNQPSNSCCWLHRNW
jgi:hypothetical protein